MKIKASKPFTHAGQPAQPGDVIDVPADAAAWLFKQGVAARSSRGIAGAATKD